MNNEVSLKITQLMLQVKQRAKTSGDKRLLNRIHSKLEDAKGLSLMLEPTTGDLVGEDPRECICEEGAVNVACEIHGR